MNVRSILGALPLLVAPLLSQNEPPVNRLAQETSPYLLQHRSNPVDWYPWGAEALARAKAEQKPIFLSIGYSACHWCHVMEHESFEDPAIAALMNAKFVNIKVDREERPDLDEIYMAAVVAMNGNGGWPMSVWLTPELRPFFGGTYFPPEEGRGAPSFRRVIEHIDRVWIERRKEAEAAGEDLHRYLQQTLQPVPQVGDPTLAHLDAAVEQSLARHDSEHGGFGRPPWYQPKFPHASELGLLLRFAARTGHAAARAAVETTLVKMARGGIYDQLAGGFHRYSVDRIWLVPHFEKMLYDNTQLARVYTEAYLLTGNELFAQIARETLDYLRREMQDPAGGFWSTTDADSEGEEGKFFVFDYAEVQRVLGADAPLALARYGITEHGNWEHRNILTAALDEGAVAAQVGKPLAEVHAGLGRCRAKLLAHRQTRVPPATDDKVLAAWNGLALDAFAYGYQVFGDPRDLEAAQRAADFVLGQMQNDGRLLRSWRHGSARLGAYLEDYAFIADGLLTLFEADFDPRWLASARGLLQTIATHFSDPEDGGLFFTADDHEPLVARNKSVSESSVPSGQAVAARAFLRAGLLFGDQELTDLGRGVVRANERALATLPAGCPSLLSTVELMLSDPREVVIAGEPDEASVKAMLARVRRTLPPHYVVTLLHAGNRERLRSMAEVFVGKDRVAGQAAAYVCRRGVCDAPVTSPEQLVLHRVK